MIRRIRVNNYKSIPDLTLELGRVTVLIGANGSGKSNILEAIALASAAAQQKLDNEFLISRGIRVTDARFMRSAFSAKPRPHKSIRISFEEEKDDLTLEEVNRHPDNIFISINGDDNFTFDCNIFADESATYPKWRQMPPTTAGEMLRILDSYNLSDDDRVSAELIQKVFQESYQRWLDRPRGSLPEFLVFAPENSALRTFQAEGQILPLGINGEGLFAHLKGLSTKGPSDRLAKIKQKLSLIDWFNGFDIPDDLGPGERSIRLHDRYLSIDAAFDQRSANEGFLFLLFYVTLFVSPETPAFFSIDNIDNSLNPKLCTSLLQLVVTLAKEFDRQVILTTHNPAILDGLNLNDDEQRLNVVDRNKAGHTRVVRVAARKPSIGDLPVSLSEAFMRGYIGGLPKNF